MPYASSPYCYDFVVTAHSPFQKYLANSPDGKSVQPVFGDPFVNEPVPVNGYLNISDLDKPGFGLELNPAARLLDATYTLNPTPERPLDGTSAPEKALEKSEEQEVVLNSESSAYISLLFQILDRWHGFVFGGRIMD